VAAQLEHSPFARELLRLQMIADMGAGGKVIVVDSQSPSAKAVAMQASGQQPLAPQATHHTQPVYPQTT